MVSDDVEEHLGPDVSVPEDLGQEENLKGIRS